MFSIVGNKIKRTVIGKQRQKKSCIHDSRFLASSLSENSLAYSNGSPLRQAVDDYPY